MAAIWPLFSSPTAQKITDKTGQRKNAADFLRASTEAGRVGLWKCGQEFRSRLTKWHWDNDTCAEFAQVLKELGIRQSVGRTGICFGNALAESINGALKVELVHRTVYPTRKKARDDIARWIELRYNRTRLHSRLGYRTPQEVMDEYLEMQAAA